MLLVDNLVVDEEYIFHFKDFNISGFVINVGRDKSMIDLRRSNVYIPQTETLISVSNKTVLFAKDILSIEKVK